MINIVFEGSTGSGKTTIINKLVEELKKDLIKVGFTNDIDESTPLYDVIKSMFDDNVLVTSGRDFSTIQYETLVQAADYLYLREHIYGQNNDVNLMDRNFCSVIAYQSVLMDTKLPYAKEFMNNTLQSILLGEKNVDLMVFFNPPMEQSLAYSQMRDKRTYSDEEIQMLIAFNQHLKAIITSQYNKNQLMIVDYDYTIDEMVKVIKSKIKALLYSKAGMDL